MMNTEKVIRERLDERIVAHYQGLRSPAVLEVIEFSGGVSFSLSPKLQKDTNPFDRGEVSYEQPSSLLPDNNAAAGWLDSWYPGQRGLTQEAFIEACSAPGRGLGQPLILAAAVASYTRRCVSCNGWSAKDCGECTNRGEVRCNNCNGKGRIEIEPCLTCNGYGGGGSLCKTCSGKGYFDIECDKCRGQGKLYGYEDKPVPGTHLVTREGVEWTCEQCRGSGRERVYCSSCAGTGFSLECPTCRKRKTDQPPLPEKKWELCNSCKGEQYKTCQTCLGKSSHRSCERCNSTGNETVFKYLRQKLGASIKSISLITPGLNDSLVGGVVGVLPQYCSDNVNRAVLENCTTIQNEFSACLRLATPIWVAKVSDLYFHDHVFVAYDPAADVFYGLDKIRERADEQRSAEERARTKARYEALLAEANALVRREEGRPTLIRSYGPAIHALVEAKLLSANDNSLNEMLDAVRSKDAKARKIRRKTGVLLVVGAALLMVAPSLIERSWPKKPIMEQFVGLASNLGEMFGLKKPTVEQFVALAKQRRTTDPREEAVRLEEALVATLAANPSAEAEIAAALRWATPEAVFGSPSAMALLKRHFTSSQVSENTLSRAYGTRCPEDPKVCRTAATLFERAYWEVHDDKMRNELLQSTEYFYWKSGDEQKTIEWMTRAVEAGRPYAESSLASYFEYKIHDCKKARYWRDVHIKKDPVWAPKDPVYRKRPGGCF